jgi:hypothetical protein
MVTFSKRRADARTKVSRGIVASQSAPREAGTSASPALNSQGNIPKNTIPRPEMATTSLAPNLPREPRRSMGARQSEAIRKRMKARRIGSIASTTNRVTTTEAPKKMLAEAAARLARKASLIPVALLSWR